MSDLDQSILKRLAFIKYLFSSGIKQSNSPEPLSAASILTFHDSIELFLQLSSEYLDIGKNQPNFMEYWDIFKKKKPPIELSQKESMRRLNKARVSLKHHGTFPSKLDIEAFRASCTNFFKENSIIVFNIDFSKVSLIDFAQPESARLKLIKAKELSAKGKLEEATDSIAIAFTQVINHYEKTKHNSYEESPFFVGKNLRWKDSFGLDLGDSGIEKKLSSFVDDVKETLEAMQETIKILTLGIDFKKYSKFKMHMPIVHQTMGGTYHIVRNTGFNSVKTTEEDVNFCIDFVVESTIILYEFDYIILK